MAKYSHGQSKGVSDRKTSGRLTALNQSTAAIKQYDLKSGAGATPKFKTNTNDYYQSQPLNVPPAIQIPNPPKAHDNSQNLKNLATAFGDINTKLQAFSSDFWEWQGAMDRAARKRAEIRAAEEELEEDEKVNSANTQLNKAKDALEKKGQTDPEAKASYGIFASMDQRVEREYGVVKAKNNGLNAISNLDNYALEIYENSFNDPTREDKESGDIIPVNPGTSEFTELLLDKIKGEINNPRAYLELQPQVQAGILSARRKISTIHATYKDNKSTETLKLGYGSQIKEFINASEEKITGYSINEAGEKFQIEEPASFNKTINHFKLKSGTSLENYQKNTDPKTLLTHIAQATIENVDRTDLADGIETVETMLMNTRIGAGKGQLLADRVGGKEKLQLLWKQAISNARNEAYRITDLVDVNAAEETASTWALKVINDAGDADLTLDGVQEFGDQTTYTVTIDGKEESYIVNKPPGHSTVALERVRDFFKNEKKNAYRKFETGIEIRAYHKILDEHLTGWLRTEGIEEQNVNHNWLSSRITEGNNPIQTKALIIYFGDQGWITKDHETSLLQDHSLKAKLDSQRQLFERRMKEPYTSLDLKLKTLFQLHDPSEELEVSKWSSDNQELYDKYTKEFRDFANETYGSLNQDDYQERIKRIVEREKALHKELDDKIEAAKQGRDPFKVQPITKSISEEFKDDKQEIDEQEVDDNEISVQEYASLDKEEQEDYRSVSNSRGRITHYKFDPVLVTPREYVDGLGGLKGRGDDQFNANLKTEVTTTTIYDAAIFAKQLEALEHLAKEERNESLNWDQTVRNLKDNRIWGLRNVRKEIDFESIDRILKVTGLTPKEFFLAQAKIHGADETMIARTTELLDKLFLPPSTDLNEDKLKKNNKVGSSISNQETLIASTDLSWMPAPRVNPKQNLEKQMLNVIHKGESTIDIKGEGYEAFNQGGADEGKTVLGFSGTYGDHPANKGKKLTEMTIQEILDIQDSGYNTDLYPFTKEGTKKWHDSGGIHAAGRYQLLRGAIRDAMRFTGIKPTEKFTPEIQDRLGLAYLLQFGPSKWTSMEKKENIKLRKELDKLLDKYKKTDWTKSSTIRIQPDIA